MLQQTIDKLNIMKLYGMVKSLLEQDSIPKMSSLSFEDRFSLIVDQEYCYKENNKTKRILKNAKFRYKNACVEDIEYGPKRNLDKKFILELSNCNWIKNHLNIIITGAAGLGKSWLACAIANNACRQGYSARYFRFPRLFEIIGLSRGDGSYIKFMEKLFKYDILLLDDWGLSQLSKENRKDVLEILEDRYDCKSTIITSQLPVEHWHEIVGDPTIADALLDRIVHNSYKINLKGKKSLREEKQKMVKKDE